LKKFFERETLTMSINPDEVVARGAAIRAAMIMGSRSLAKIDFTNVTPFSLGMQNVGDKFSVIVPRNTSVPCSRTEEYVTVYDYQTSIDVRIYEGEDKIASRNNLLGEFVLEGIPSAPNGKEPLDVTIDVDAEGILHVTAKVRSTGLSQQIEIRRAGLTADEVQNIKKL
jgi:molecular chaperone DnaK (HSP70)